MISAGQFIVKFLEARGVDRAYCVPGESFLPVLDAFVDSDIDVITTHHESSAGFMALADGRMTGRPGICMVSRGPGATNAAIAMHTADQDGVPMILFVGQVERKNLRRGSFQEIDYSAMYGSYARWVVEVSDPERLPEAMTRAWHAAVDGTPGPVVVSMPEDMLEEMMEPVAIRPYKPTITFPDPDAVDSVAALLAKASRPVIIAGAGIVSGLGASGLGASGVVASGPGRGEDGRAALLRMAEHWSIPVIVSFRRHDLFPNDHPLYAGDLGVSNTPEQMAAYNDSDLIIAVGTRLGDLTTHGYTFPEIPWPKQKLVHVYNDASAIGAWFEPDVGVLADPAAFLVDLAKRKAPADNAEWRAWGQRLADIRSRIGVWKQTSAEDGVVFANVIADLDKRLENDGFIVPDAGTSAALIYQYFTFRPPQRLFATVTGVMGFGVPGGIAVAMRNPGRRVVTLVGDGGFLMTGNELAIAVERKLPLIVILSNNRSLGTIRAYQERMFPNRPVATDLSTPDFDMLAKAFGCQSYVIAGEDDIAPVMDKAFAYDGGPVFIEVKASLSAILPKPALS